MRSKKRKENVKYSYDFKENEMWIDTLKEHIDNYIMDMNCDVKYDSDVDDVRINNHVFNGYDFSYFMCWLRNLYYNINGYHCVDFVELMTQRDFHSALYEMVIEVENDSKEEE